MSAYQVTAFAVVAAILAAMLKKEKAEFALLVQLTTAAAVLLSVASAASTVFHTLIGFADRSGIGTGYIRLLLRSRCVAASGEWTAAFCKDAGMSALAVTVETATAVLLLSMCVPLMETVLDFATGFFL